MDNLHNTMCYVLCESLKRSVTKECIVLLVSDGKRLKINPTMQTLVVLQFPKVSFC